MHIERNTAANFADDNPVLGDGQIGRETDTGRYKFGNGVTAWNSLPYVRESVADTILVEGAAYTLQPRDAGARVKVTVESTITIPPASEASFPIGSFLLVQQFGADAVTIAAGAGVTLNGIAGSGAMAGQFQMVTLFCDAVDVWTASGGVGAIE